MWHQKTNFLILAPLSTWKFFFNPLYKCSVFSPPNGNTNRGFWLAEHQNFDLISQTLNPLLFDFKSLRPFLWPSCSSFLVYYFRFYLAFKAPAHAWEQLTLMFHLSDFTSAINKAVEGKAYTCYVEICQTIWIQLQDFHVFFSSISFFSNVKTI